MTKVNFIKNHSLIPEILPSKIMINLNNLLYSMDNKLNISLDSIDIFNPGTIYLLLIFQMFNKLLVDSLNPF
jgi:hypothetical protein